jgi:hypothetical protein
MTVVSSFVFARPRVLAQVATRVGLAEPRRATFWRATALSASVLLFALVPATLTYALGATSFHYLTDPIVVGFAVAVALDVHDDLRARRGTLVHVWSLQQAQHADLVAHDLATAGIPCHLASSNLRALLAFFGPFVPVDVLVPEEHAKQAHERIAKLYAA